MNSIKGLKVSIKLALQLTKDLMDGCAFRFAKPFRNNFNFKYFIELTQEIKPGETFENKVYNISLASEKISECVILPNQVFSFWNIIGNPNKNFKSSRSIINGQTKNELGGGICQVSGIIYQMSLMASLPIMERHNHSIDLYNEETRFAPLGTDATVVYGYKDLRLTNPFSFPIKFEINVSANLLTLKLCSSQKIEISQLFYEQINSEENIIVTVKSENERILNTSMYRKISN